ncbi:MAG: Mut7-C RNAse domain-containing protein [Desulfobacter postgatei]|nr:Mut7-C RNAse domain-containing protein [Desulfobacter postgatei]MDD4274854.1 Mut7-C RNAse domain-containing protein [Desulfobacter postgatei]
MAARLTPKPRRYYNNFFQCPRCSHVYWRGFHRNHIIEKRRAAGLVTDII